jgi:hypothetical protein
MAIVRISKVEPKHQILNNNNNIIIIIIIIIIDVAIPSDKNINTKGS